ncbi:MAG: NPCBM/NEW2 domain-containing protein [Candidatus Doudnabacteria bacterium]|nr:NPCBM/NEW2 domain-containing protein [Candidatus Doudnabacteria bacterium]
MKKNHFLTGTLRLLLVSIFTVAIFAASQSAKAASIYFVDGAASSSSDTNTGTESSPWKTLQRAASALKAGDKVIVKPALYKGDVVPVNSGSSSAYITYEARDGATIDGAGIKINQKQYIEIVGFKIQNTSGEGITIAGPNARFINLKNNYTWNTGGSGIAVWGRAWGNDPAECSYDCASDILIEGNRIERANNVKIGGGYNEHLTVASGVKRITIRKNILTAGPMPQAGFEAISGGEGIDLKEGVTDAWVYENEIHDMVYCRYGIYIDAGGSTWGYPETYKTTPGWMRNINVYNNKVYKNDGHGIGIVSEGSGNMDGVYVYNNLVYQNGNDGILVYDWGLTGKTNPPKPLPTAANIYIFNNTVYKNAQIRNWYGGIALDHKFATNVVIRNNLTFGNPSNIRRYNVPTATQIDNNLETNGLVTSADSGDFSLPSSSAAIDKASSNLPINLTFDFNKTQRPFNSKFDVGAFEYSYVPPTAPLNLVTNNTSALSNNTIYLSNLAPVKTTNGWGPYERDMSNGEQAEGDGKTITLNGVTYQKGIGSHALAEITYNIPSYCSAFMSSIGVDDEVDSRGSVAFQVYANGGKIFDSGIMTNLSPTQNINIPLNNITVLQLVTQNGGDDYGSDHGSWGDARIICIPPVQNTNINTSIGINQPSPAIITAQPGKSFALTYNWNGGPTTQNYTAFVHFINSANAVIFQDDHIPTINTKQWQGGKFSYIRTITLPSNLPAGTYKIMAGLYDPATGARLALTPGSGVITDTTEGQRYHIATLIIPSSTPPPPPVVPQGPWTAQYYNWTSANDYFKTLRLTRTDAAINFEWDMNSPANGVTNEKFAVRWTADLNFPVTGTYNFSAETDDGMRIWIDNVLVLNKWQNQSTTYRFSHNLTQGKHNIKVEYYENTVAAKAKLSWTLGNVAGALTPVKITQNLSKGFGINSGQVLALQQYLRQNGYLSAEPNGVFGKQTEEAVKKLQRQYNINPTGIVGPLTRNIINTK